MNTTIGARGLPSADNSFRDDVAEATRVISQQEALRVIAKHKVRNYTANQCTHGIADCHDTLQQGQYEYTHPYAQKLWAEIDAMRERQSFLSKC